MTSPKHLPASAATLPLPSAGEVHLWRADLDATAVDPACLDADEAARAARFLHPAHGHRFAASRTVLKGALARYLGGAAAEVRFAYTDLGRPSVAGAAFDFNLSHTETDFVLAVALERIGVDIERRARQADLDGLARQVMTADEQARFAALPPERKRAAFYDLWTAKEAVMKALGTGFSRDPRTLAVDWRERPVWQEGGLRLELRRFDAAPGLAGALAMAGKVRKVTFVG